MPKTILVTGSTDGIGAEILVRAALAEEFAAASGKYFDNGSGQFAKPHRDALDPQKSAQVVQAIEAFLAEQ
jgi:NAD(P)-dependent dehydrogenase (short-subunit alcohol dehydrogenase family)